MCTCLWRLCGAEALVLLFGEGAVLVQETALQVSAGHHAQ